MSFPYNGNEMRFDMNLWTHQIIDSQIQNPSENCVATDGYILATGTEPMIRNRLLHIGFLIFRVFWNVPQAFSFRPSLADAN